MNLDASRTIAMISRHRFLALLAAVSLGIAACGGGETVDAGEATGGFTPMTPRTDLEMLQIGVPAEIVVDPNDDSRLLIHFEGAAEPCSGAAVTVTETDTDVAIVFQIGLDPNAAAMSCIAQVFDYEIAVQLEAPLGERAIGIAS